MKYSKNILPIFTSNTSHPPMVVSASMWYGDDQPYKAVEGYTGDRDYWYVNGGTNNWWKIDFGEGKKIGKIKMGAGAISGSSHGIKNYEVFGSFDDNTYFSLLAGTHPNNAISQTIELQNVQKYQYYKIIVYDSYYSARHTAIKDLAMYELLTPNKIFLSSNNKFYSIDDSNQLIDVTSSIENINNITKEEFEDCGFEDISLVNNSPLYMLEKPVKIICLKEK